VFNDRDPVSRALFLNAIHEAPVADPGVVE